MMTLRRTMGLQIAAMIVGLLLLGGASLWGIQGLRQDFGEALRGYQELRDLYEIGSHAATAKELIEAGNVTGRPVGEVVAAIGKFELTFGAQSQDAAHRELGDALNGAIKELHTDSADMPPDPQLQVAALNRVLNRLANRAAELRKSIEGNQSAGEEKLHRTMIAMGVVCVLVIAGAVVLGIWLYRAVTRPLAELAQGARQLGRGKFDQRISTQSPAELAALAGDFNRMARELEELYRDLEQKVSIKSRELVQSERLASVGFLAAGVAHEINNPLGIIAGYAEVYLQKYPDSEASESMRVICQEAFRCKGITEKLLTLARPGDLKRQKISLTAVAGDVVSIVGGLEQYRQSTLSIQSPPGDGMEVVGAEGEIKQVLLNLTLNALEAVEGQRGVVRIELKRQEGWIELSVLDNGRGMSVKTLEHVFEPFFTSREGGTRRGTGLGLSISHAIVREHAGEISAQSDGPGKGSRFVVRLPAAGEGASV